MAGTLPCALQQQVDQNGKPQAGALLYFFQVGTVGTLQNSFQDFALSLPNPNPLTADQFGRIPMFYLADGQVHARLTDASGVVIWDYPNMQVIGPSSGGGGGGGVDASTVASTGDVKYRLTSEALTGWIKLNGLSLGAPTSGATQRANVDTQNLFVYLWNNFLNAHCPVSGGRGASGLADFNGNKTIAVPDMRGRLPVGLDDMGATAAGRLLSSNITSGGGDGVTTPAATGGEANHILTLLEAPTGLQTLNDPGHIHTANLGVLGTSLGGQTASTPGAASSAIINSHTTGITLTDNAGGQSHNNMPPFLIGTWYMHL